MTFTTWGVWSEPMSDTYPIRHKGCPVVFVQNGEARQAESGYTFRHRRTGRIFKFSHGWERRLDALDLVVLEPKYLRLQGSRMMTYQVAPTWKVQHLDPQDAIDDARRATMQFLQDILPPGAEVHIRIKLPEPPMIALDPTTSTVQMLDDLRKKGDQDGD